MEFQVVPCLEAMAATPSMSRLVAEAAAAVATSAAVVVVLMTMATQVPEEQDRAM